MTEHEMFEEKFPVPSETVWSDHLSAYVQKNRRVLSAYDDLWQVWQAARATPALPQGVEEWIAANSHPLYFADSGEGFGSEAVFANDLRAYLSGMAIVPVDKLPAAVAVELSRLRDFRSAVIGWRESDHPEGFCRKTAEFVVLLGQIAAKDELK